jgi:hypothetical protein
MLIVFRADRIAASMGGKMPTPFLRIVTAFPSDIGEPVRACMVCRKATSRTPN